MGLSRQASDCDSTIQFVRGPYPEAEKRAWSCHGIKGRLPLHLGRRPPGGGSLRKSEAPARVAPPEPSGGRISRPSPRMSRSCATPEPYSWAVACILLHRAEGPPGGGSCQDQKHRHGWASCALWRAYFLTVSQAVPELCHAQSRPAGLRGFRAVFTPSRKFSALRVQVAHSQ